MKWLLCALAASALLACAAELRQQPKTSLGPADPDAPESSPLPIPTALAPEPDLPGEAVEKSGPSEPDPRAHEHHHEAVEKPPASEPDARPHEHDHGGHGVAR